jgi:tetratricopeptide (TPR) repeat protein
MAKKETEETIIDVQEAYSKTEKYIEENKKRLSTITLIVVGIAGLFFAYKYVYLPPLEKEAAEQMWKAEQYFEKDSFDLAINGDGNYPGFEKIADNYGSTNAGNLAKYYLGICYLRKGDYQVAIDYLSDFDSDDEMLGPVAKGAIGDAYMELGNTDEALNYYLKAAGKSENTFTAPIYLMKAGLAYEALSDYKGAKKVYTKIKNNYPESNEGRNVEKYLARAEAKTAK